MVCYIVPLAAWLASAARRKALRKSDVHGMWLNIMLLGGALFGGIDHFWNGELLLLGANWAMDLALGFTITLGITGAWGLLVWKDRMMKQVKPVEGIAGVQG